MTTTTALYRMYDINKTLLYVGISFDPSRRLPKHMYTKQWWDLVADIHIERFPTRQDAATAEMVAIENEDPVFNISRPNAQTKPGIVINVATCCYCHQQFLDEIYPDSDSMDECEACNETVSYAYDSGRRSAQQQQVVTNV